MGDEKTDGKNENAHGINGVQGKANNRWAEETCTPQTPNRLLQTLDAANLVLLNS